MKQVEIAGIHLEATTGEPLVLLREQEAPHRVVPIFVGGPEAASIALALSGEGSPRPLTHDVMASLVKTLGGGVERVEVTEIRDGSFLAEVSLNGLAGERRLDARPSDAIALAVRLHAPVFLSEGVLDEAGALLEEATDEDLVDEPTDEDLIEEELEEFRAFLDDLDPSDFADPGAQDA